MSKIELEPWNFQIKNYNGDEVVQLKPSLAFDTAFIEQMKTQGVGYAKEKETQE